MACSRPTMNSSKRSTRVGSWSLRRDSGDVSAGYSVTNVGRSAGSVFSPAWSNSAPTRSPWLSDLRRTAPSSSPRAATPLSSSHFEQRRAVVEHRPLEPRGQQAAARRLDHRVLERDARPRRRQADRLPLVGERLAARDLARQLDEQRLGQRHQVLVRRVRLIELEHRELGVVLARQPLVAEVAADLVDAFEAADDQALEVQLGRDAHVEVEIERVVVRGERARRGAAQDRVHHRRLDLEIAARVEEAAERRDDRAALAEHLAHLAG